MKKVEPERVKRDSEVSRPSIPKSPGPNDVHEKNARILALTQQLNAALNQKKKRTDHDESSDDDWEKSSDSGSDN